MTSQPGILRVEGLHKSYLDHRVLIDLNLTLEPGKIYGLLGRNGAGKTTLLSCLSAQRSFERGTITYGGEPVWENRAALEHICFARAFSAARNSWGATQSVARLLSAAAIFYPNWDEDYARRLLDTFEIGYYTAVKALSAGGRTALGIVIALASRCALTLLDEPAAGLDVIMRERFYRLLLDDFTETGRTFLLSTHIIEEAAPVFEEVILLDGGRILEQAPTEALLAQFHTISGHQALVEEVCRGLTVLQSQQMGRLLTCTVRCDEQALAPARGADVDIAPVSLQGVFTALCGHGASEERA